MCGQEPLFYSVAWFLARPQLLMKFSSRLIRVFSSSKDIEGHVGARTYLHTSLQDGTVVNADQQKLANVLIRDGKIAEVSPDLRVRLASMLQNERCPLM